MASNHSASVLVSNGAYIVKFPYDPMAVSMLKSAIPSTGRSWDNNTKAWVIAAQYRRQAENALGMSFPDIAPVKIAKETRVLEVHYLGACKERAPGEVSAMGLLKNGAWGAVFSQDTLTAWFEDAPVNSPLPGVLTLYSILGAHQGDDDNAIKSAYRRMARQWHPDVCREPNAAEMFLRIREAYDVLSSPKKRGRYDAGLLLEASINQTVEFGSSLRMDTFSAGMYRAPLRCGYILAEGVESLGRFVVSKILGWEDIQDAQGRVMVSSWPRDGKEPVIAWA